MEKEKPGCGYWFFSFLLLMNWNFFWFGGKPTSNLPGRFVADYNDNDDGHDDDDDDDDDVAVAKDNTSLRFVALAEILALYPFAQKFVSLVKTKKSLNSVCTKNGQKMGVNKSPNSW